MLDQEKITIGKLKQAYNLNAQDVETLLCALSPDNAFPYVLWQKAYSTFWRGSASEISRLYKVDNPQFPDAGTLPDKYFPTGTYAAWIVEFFTKLSAMVNVAALEKGLEHIIEATYDGEAFAFKQPKEDLFHTLYLSEKNIANITRINGVRDNRSALPVHYEFIAHFFPDTVVVDKAAAVHYLDSCAYPLRQEVKGLSRAFVERTITEPPTPPQDDIPPQDNTPPEAEETTAHVVPDGAIGVPVFMGRETRRSHP